MEGDLQVALGRNMRRLRKGRGLSQERFGEMVGWHRTFVGAVERGERNLTLRSIERVSAQLGADPLALLGCGQAVGVAPDVAAPPAPPPLLVAAADGESVPAAAESGDDTGPPRRHRPRPG